MRAEYQASAIIQTELSGWQKQKKKKKSRGRSRKCQKNSLHVGGAHVTQSLARNIFQALLYLSSETFNNKLQPFEKL